jgi:hypothetical protein
MSEKRHAKEGTSKGIETTWRQGSVRGPLNQWGFQSLNEVTTEGHCSSHIVTGTLGVKAPI